MSGRFQKAPLIYVTAHVQLSMRPDLLEKQWASLEQSMIRVGLKQPRRKVGRVIDLTAWSDEHDANEKINSQRLVHFGFFSSDFTEGLILGPDFLEFRTTTYQDYSSFRTRMLELFQSVMTAVDILGALDVSEVVLTYCDVIVPAYGRPLKGYFSQPDALPLNLLAGTREDKSQVAQAQATRLVSEKQKVTVALEQVPVGEGQKIRKWLPNGMVEPDKDFAMPLNIRPEWSERQNEPHYALLTTQSSRLPPVQALYETPLAELFDSLHQLTRDAFDEIIHTDHCRQDWDYTESP